MALGSVLDAHFQAMLTRDGRPRPRVLVAKLLFCCLDHVCVVILMLVCFHRQSLGRLWDCGLIQLRPR
jgi:hypothetical protein